MSKAIKRIVVVGGGTAGWLAAGVIAAEHNANKPEGIDVTLIESPDVDTIGVGEGTWPTLRGTLSKIGVSETDLFRECDASFKQGVKYVKWVTGKDDDAYYHPFSLPQGFGEADLVQHWRSCKDKLSFADAMTFQSRLCDEGLAPKQLATPEYAAVANYGYHLNAGKLGAFLKKHCTEKLGVRYIEDHVVAVNSSADGGIASLKTKLNGDLAGDLFIDCSGLSGLLIDKHFNIPFVSRKHVLFNDSALAVHVPYESESSPIIPYTLGTAQSAGWIWDIGLQTRRGVGNVYSSAHISDEQAEIELRCYIASSIGDVASESLDINKLSINPGHRAKFWHKNCVALGMAAGFLEPLEASAIVMMELASSMISDELPATRELMDITAKRYNETFLYRWDRIIDFLKLHYVLSKRTDSEYWLDNRSEDTIPERLQDLLQLWRYQSPSRYDFNRNEEMFPSASWQYILYGMGFDTQSRETSKRATQAELALKHFKDNQGLLQKYLSGLPRNRDLIEKICHYGMKNI